MLAICAYYAGIMLNAFGTYYAHNYAGIIGSSLQVCMQPSSFIRLLTNTVWHKNLHFTVYLQIKSQQI